MRDIYTSPRPENIDRVVALFAKHGIETRITNRRVYDHRSYRRFSYGPGENRAGWARVEIRHARDLTKARALLRDAGIAPLTRYAEELASARQPQRRATPQAMARRVRTIALAVLAAATVVLVIQMIGQM